MSCGHSHISLPNKKILSDISWKNLYKFAEVCNNVIICTDASHRVRSGMFLKHVRIKTPLIQNAKQPCFIFETRMLGNVVLLLTRTLLIAAFTSLDFLSGFLVIITFALLSVITYVRNRMQKKKKTDIKSNF